MNLSSIRNIVYLGGSVTVGEGIWYDYQYTTLVNSYIHQNWNKDIKIYNLGRSGTTSTYGFYLLNTSVLTMFAPDLVFVEFAINDTKDDWHQMAFEGILHEVLTANPAALVVPILTRNRSGYSCRGYMSAIAHYYGLPVIDVAAILTERLDAGIMTWEDYSFDYGHPNESGHKIIADIVCDFLEHDLPSITPPVALPSQTFLSQNFFHTHFHGIRWTNFQPSCSIQASCRYIFLLYEVSNTDNYGTAVLCVNNKKVATLQSYRFDSWPHTFCHIIDLGTSDTHTISLHMSQGEEGKKFVLADIGTA